MRKFSYIFITLLLFTSCSENESEEQVNDIASDFEPKLISNEANIPIDTIETPPPALVETEIIAGELQTQLPNSFKLKGVNPQNPGTGVKDSKLYEYVEAGNSEITFFFIKTIYESKDQTIDTHFDAIKNGPRIGSDRKALVKVSINEEDWLYEQYIMKEPNGTPVTYEDFIYIDQDVMYGLTVCCNSDVYSKWSDVIIQVKDGLTVL